MTGKKIGEGHAAGMGRKGFTEFGQYLTAFNNAGMSVIEDAGVFPNATQGEIAQGRRNEGSDLEQESTDRKLSMEELRKFAAERASEAEQGMEKKQQQDVERE